MALGLARCDVDSSFAPFGAHTYLVLYPRLAPWAVFYRRFAAEFRDSFQLPQWFAREAHPFGEKSLQATLYAPTLWAHTYFALYPRLAPLRQAQGRLWAAFYRRFAAEFRFVLVCLFHRDCHPHAVLTKM